MDSLAKRYDAIAKQLLSYKYVLAWILKGYVPEFAECEIEDIVNKYIETEPEVSETPVHQNEKIKGQNTEDSTLDEGTVYYDIRFEALAPKSNENIRIIINVEAQNNANPGYDLWKRAEYYCCRLISAQKGTVFTKSEYSKIQKVYSIWLLPNVTGELENTITSYHITEKQIYGDYHRPKESYDLMQFIMVGLGNKAMNDKTAAQRLLSTLLAKKNLKQDKKNIYEEYNIPLNRNYEEAIGDMCNLSQGLISDGRAEGKIEGKNEAKKEFIKNLLANGSFTHENIASLVGLSVDEVEKIISELMGES